MATPVQLAEKSKRDQQGVLSAETLKQVHSSPSSYSAASCAQLTEISGCRSLAASLSSATAGELAVNGTTRVPESSSSDTSSRLSPRSSGESQVISEQWQYHDARKSLTQSLAPSGSGDDNRRTLLNIFVHGFLGNETSFQSFPAHLHNLLTITLAETHVVHTKIYPRYKSRKPISFARDNFSTWLEPHEHEDTDIVIYGHSMGGILSAEVALRRPYSNTKKQAFHHRILGTINFDTPFLGMHPGVIVSGIGGLFRRDSEPRAFTAGQSVPGGTNTPPHHIPTSSSSSESLSANDSRIPFQTGLVQSITSPSSYNNLFFDPPFQNDVRIPERKGLNKLFRFISKHAEGPSTYAKLNGLTSATSKYFVSHLEFGGCLADYAGLQQRYDKVRSLEDVDDIAGRHFIPPATRVRFVNYYTASTGRVKIAKPASEDGKSGQGVEPMGLPNSNENLKPEEICNLAGDESGDPQRDASHDALLEAVKDQVRNAGEESGVRDDIQDALDMRLIDSTSITTGREAAALVNNQFAKLESKSTPEPPLALLPKGPNETPKSELDAYTVEDARIIVEKEQKRVLKIHQQDLKDKQRANKDRERFLEKQEKTARQIGEKREKAEHKARLKEAKGKLKDGGEDQATIHPKPASQSQKGSAKQNKKFCLLPGAPGESWDKCWVRVYMEGVDEVGAHCGLFLPGPQYESLLGNVGERVENWILEDASRRAIIAAESED